MARSLPADGYSDPIVFTNLTNDTVLTQDGAGLTGVTRRFVTLNVLGGGASSFQGFGAGTRGGAGGTVFHVTTLEDNGDDAHPVPGSLRDAVSRRNRYVVFDVAGTIVMQTFLYVYGDHITIDGSSAPPPGITITQYGIIIRANRGAHDVVVRGVRVRDIVRSPTADTQWDGIQVANGAFKLGEHVTPALALMLLMMVAVLVWFVWFIVARCDRVQRHQMIALISMILMCLVFFTLYEQTYGSWVTFTDRLLTKDVVPALVQPTPALNWSGDWIANLTLFAQTTPWSIIASATLMKPAMLAPFT